jgi:hypothetical protein
MIRLRIIQPPYPALHKGNVTSGDLYALSVCLERHSNLLPIFSHARWHNHSLHRYV